MNNVFTIIFSFLFYIQNLVVGSESTTIKLNTIPVDSIDSIDSLLPSRKPIVDSTRFKEKIEVYPQNYTVKSVYQFREAQQSYGTFKYMLENESYKDEYIKINGEESYNFVMSMKNVNPFDCIISACLLEDENNKTYIVFDKNNDEDLSNDIILSFNDTIKIQGQDTSLISVVESDVFIEYFNGKTILKDKFSFKYQIHDSKNRKRNFLFPTKMKIGKIVLNGQKFTVALIPVTAPSIEYNKFDFIWIDLNNNNIYDEKLDYWDQLYLPFTIENNSYIITEIDRFGKYVELSKCNIDKYPPIAVGLPAPNFTALTIDSLDFELKNLFGKPILLDFWGCNSNIYLSNLSNISDKYKDKGLKIVSHYGFGDYRMPLSPGNKNIEIDWIHLQGQLMSDFRKLYQVGSLPTSILIDKNGDIVYIEKLGFYNIDKFLSDYFKK